MLDYSKAQLPTGTGGVKAVQVQRCNTCASLPRSLNRSRIDPNPPYAYNLCLREQAVVV